MIYSMILLLLFPSLDSVLFLENNISFIHILFMYFVHVIYLETKSKDSKKDVFYSFLVGTLIYYVATTVYYLLSLFFKDKLKNLIYIFHHFLVIIIFLTLDKKLYEDPLVQNYILNVYSILNVSTLFQNAYNIILKSGGDYLPFMIIFLVSFWVVRIGIFPVYVIRNYPQKLQPSLKKTLLIIGIIFYTLNLFWGVQLFRAVSRELSIY